MSATLTEYYVQLIDQRTDRPIADDTGVYTVMTAGDPALVTVYSDSVGTALTLPGTMTSGVIRFFAANAVTSCDVSVLTANGHAFFLKGLTPSQHRIVVSPESMQSTLVLPYKVVGASEAVVSTGFSLSANLLVKDVFLHTTTLGTGAAIDVGTSTTQSGFAVAVTVDATGFPVALLNEQLASAAKIGSLLAASATADYARKLYVRANATSGASIVYSNTTSSSTAGAGYIYLTLLRVPA